MYISLIGILFIGSLMHSIAYAQLVNQNEQINISFADQARRNLVISVRNQAIEVWKLSISLNSSKSFPYPKGEFGPNTGNSRFPYGWSIYDVGGKYIQLSDVNESVVYDFNKAIHGVAKKFDFHGANAFNNSKPYGAYANDSDFSLILPIKWLLQDEIEFSIPQPGNVELTHESIFNNTKLIVGTSLTQAWLESLGIFTLDDLSATAVFYSLADLQKSSGIAENLLGNNLDSFQEVKSLDRIKLMGMRKKCMATFETFTRKDCSQELVNAFGAYGKKIVDGKILNLWASGIINWDDSHKRISIPNIHYHFGHETGNECQENSICLRLGSYGAANNVMCYKLLNKLPQTLNIPMSEAQVRDLSKQAGGFNNLSSISAILEVTAPIKSLEGPRMCKKNNHNKVIAEGAALIKQITLWSDKQAEYAIALTNETLNSESKLVIPTIDAVAPLKAVVNQLPKNPSLGVPKPVLETK